MAYLDTSKPRWWAPDSPAPPIHVYNSLSRSKDEFKPIKEGHVSWYACGPTVYDDAHLGHARNYVTTDIIRRILLNYFGFNVNFVMNITDVDDKIILRGRQQHLLAKHRTGNASNAEASLKLAKQALAEYVINKLPLIQGDITPENVKQLVDKNYGWLQHGKGRPNDTPLGNDDEAKLKMHVRTVAKASDVILNSASTWDEEHFYDGCEDILLPYLDAREGSKIDASDHSVFTRLTARYEKRFMEDMRDLDVLDPDALTRVTEYGQKIIDYVAKVQQNGFAYKSDDGSVYFDIAAFESRGNQYAKLKPENRGDRALQADGEGALSKTATAKRSDADFALWKASKPGEPAWNSPWGKGRPGWHIECSAMATDRLGQQMDIHSGGIDLAFPHHDNELAQSEAYLRDSDHDHNHTWVNNFLHMGHLSIQGAKMSKSLKNFTTIRNALLQNQWTSRSLRIIFLLGNWKEGIEITDDMVQRGSVWEERVNNFFLNAIDLAESKVFSSEGKDDQTVMTALEEAMQKTQVALSDSFDTPQAMAEISTLISAFNSADKTQLSPRIAESVARWVTAIVSIFGLNGVVGTDNSRLGWSGISISEEAQRYVYPLSRFRDTLRRRAKETTGLVHQDLTAPTQLTKMLADAPEDSAIAKVASRFTEDVSKLQTIDSSSLKTEVLKLCDGLRDIHLWSLNIYLEDRDREQLPALVRPVTLQLKEEKERQGAEKKKREIEKAAAKAKKEAEESSRLAKGKVSPQDMYKTPEYGAWDQDGIPTKDAKGDEITKSRAKKLRKDWENQKRLHEKWKASRG